MITLFLVYLAAIFFILYGLRSLIAGLRNEKRNYWISFSYDTGLRKFLKEKYEKVNNIFWGALSLGSGILVLIRY